MPSAYVRTRSSLVWSRIQSIVRVRPAVAWMNRVPGHGRLVHPGMAGVARHPCPLAGGMVTRPDEPLVMPGRNASRAASRIEPGVATAPATPPPTAAMRAGTGVGVRTGAVAATCAKHGFGAAVPGASLRHPHNVTRIQRRDGIRVGHSHGSLRILPRFGLHDKTSLGASHSTVAEDRGGAWPSASRS
jgi:hypothetical protein